MKSNDTGKIVAIVKIAKGGRDKLCIYLPKDVEEQVEHGKKYCMTLEPAEAYGIRILKGVLEKDADEGVSKD